MASTAVLSNVRVVPTNADLYDTVPGRGKLLIEESLEKLFKVVGGGRSGVVSGFTVPAGPGPGTLSIVVTLGEAIINGHYIQKSGTQSISLSASEEVYLYLQLVRDGNGLVTAVQLATSVDIGGGGTSPEPTMPADSILLARVDTDGSNYTSTKDLRSTTRLLWGSFKGNAAGPRGRTEFAGSGGWYLTNASGTGSVINFITPFARTPYILLFEVGTTTVTLALAASTTASAEITTGTSDEFLFLVFG